MQYNFVILSIAMAYLVYWLSYSLYKTVTSIPHLLSDTGDATTSKIREGGSLGAHLLIMPSVNPP